MRYSAAAAEANSFEAFFDGQKDDFLGFGVVDFVDELFPQFIGFFAIKGLGEVHGGDGDEFAADFLLVLFDGDGAESFVVPEFGMVSFFLFVTHFQYLNKYSNISDCQI